MEAESSSRKSYHRNLAADFAQVLSSLADCAKGPCGGYTIQALRHPGMLVPRYTPKGGAVR